jgi:hypothetical protein
MSVLKPVPSIFYCFLQDIILNICMVLLLLVTVNSFEKMFKLAIKNNFMNFLLQRGNEAGSWSVCM